MMPRTSGLVHANQEGFSVRFDFKRAFVGDTLSSSGLVGREPEVGQAGPSPRQALPCGVAAE